MFPNNPHSDALQATAPLPRQQTTFVGRTQEIEKIQALLREPNCRLLTLMGAGGIGKTRLALEAATMLSPHFADGVVMVSLQDATTALQLVTATAQAVRCPLAGSYDPVAQLLNFLANKSLLLVMDNLETLRAEVDLLATLLAAAPGIKILATSRAVLNLSDEWLFPVDELPLPDSQTIERGELTELEAFDAVQLFAERARRVQTDFRVAETAQEVARICRLVGGMPLAIELAAGWLKTLTCAEVASEIEQRIEQSLDFLSTNQRDVAPRHRSIRAVCDPSWQQLSPTERTVLMALAIFPGGFQRHAAQEVARATLATLAALVEKSWLRWEPDARRYQMHELLRQYAREALSQQTALLAEVRARHCAYFVAFLRGQGTAILGGEQRAAVHAIEAELENIRLAWQWVVTQAELTPAVTDDLITLARTLIDYYQIRSRYGEGAEALAQALARWQQEGAAAHTHAIAILQTFQGSLSIRLGRIDEARTLLQQAHSYYRENDVSLMAGYNTDPAFSLGIISLIEGRYDEAIALGERVRADSEREQHPHNLLLAHYLLAVATLAQAELATAQRHAERACEIARATASHWFMAYCLNELGNIAFAQGNFEAARRHYGESYAIRQEFDDPEGMALALVRLGESALAQDDYVGARHLFQQSQMLYRQIGDQGGLTASHTGLGHAAVGLKEWDVASDHLRQALTLALTLHYLPYLGSLCYGIALLLIARGENKRGVETLAAVSRHAATPRILAGRLQQRLGSELSYLAPDFLAASRRLTAEVDLERIARGLLVRLTEPPTHSPLRDFLLRDSPSSAPAPLVETLSEREKELLQLLASGLKNREIAERMVISVNTVKVHINNIYGKLGVSNRVQAVAHAQTLGLL